SWAIDKCSPPLKRATSARRPSSAKAVNSGALRCNRRARLLAVSVDMAFDILHLGRPTSVVHAKGLVAPRRRDRVEARLGDRESRAAGDRLQAEFHQRRRFLRVVVAWVDGIGMPVVRE